MSVAEIGAALANSASVFGLPGLAITDVSKVETAPRAALCYSARSLADLQQFAQRRPLGANPVLRRLWLSAAPASLTEVRDELRLTEDELWGLVPPWVRGKEVLSVNVMTHGSHVNFTFAGSGAGLPTGLRSILHAMSGLAAGRIATLTQSVPQQERLTVREDSVLQLLAGGNSDTFVAKRLGITARTVRFHLENAKRKLNVATRAQAVLKVLRGDPQ